VAASLSRGKTKKLWDCTLPTWIEGLITREEAENALRSSKELLKEPGTFILRFPTTRSWPHPDAGSLVITYVGFDYSIHHRLLSLDSWCALINILTLSFEFLIQCMLLNLTLFYWITVMQGLEACKICYCRNLNYANWEGTHSEL
jgi:hypothetical protein